MKGVMKAIAGLDRELGMYPVTTIHDTAWAIYDAHKGLFDKDNTTFDAFITMLYADEYFATDHIRVILSENAKVYMHNNNDAPYGEMGAWELPSGVIVREVDYDYDLHAFDVCYNGRTHTVVPKDIGDMMDCIADLNAGADPVFDGWNDGLGYNLQEVLLHGQEVA